MRRDLRELAKAGECKRVYGGAVAPVPAPFIDSGTTNVAIARALRRNLPLIVATNSLGVSAALAEHPNVELKASHA